MTKRQHHTDGVDDLTGELKDTWQDRVPAALEIIKGERETVKPTTTQATVGELTSNEQRRFRSAVDSYE